MGQCVKFVSMGAGFRLISYEITKELLSRFIDIFLLMINALIKSNNYEIFNRKTTNVIHVLDNIILLGNSLHNWNNNFQYTKWIIMDGTLFPNVRICVCLDYSNRLLHLNYRIMSYPSIDWLSGTAVQRWQRYQFNHQMDFIHYIIDLNIWFSFSQ